MKISIMKPAVEHAASIAAICTTGWKQTVEGVLSEDYQKQNVEFWYNLDRVRSDILQGSYSHIGVIDSEIVGVIGGGMTGPAASEVFVLYVDETYRYQGVGRLLLEALTQEQIEQGAEEQWVSVQEGNQRGIPFYEARGFVYQTNQITDTDTGEQQVSLRYSRSLI
ncbi:GNAT family N-acetyltransferase [Mesobacillus maritimus]|uniref:GNAT family N-acetyltransferase n=1 Tax=Mesobacillus maritimus TaxID=1643336 RepID=UPI00203AFD48|nr:GNAT family N-acetyltransferase [Mesobacillus maritimus]MCM3587450.1 GNAT family N-acetyltransferase [Mesobacillus maritimus]MCM3671097.1 GNAT family N-acetyltransferase [Mesobacillus maritimus]